LQQALQSDRVITLLRLWLHHILASIGIQPFGGARVQRINYFDSKASLFRHNRQP